MAPDVVNPKTLELETAKEILSELFDIMTHEVDEMIRQRMEERTLYGQEFNLSAAQSFKISRRGSSLPS